MVLQIINIHFIYHRGDLWVCVFGELFNFNFNAYNTCTLANDKECYLNDKFNYGAISQSM